MPKSRTQKERDLEELTAKLKEAKAVVLSDYRGTDVKDMDKFRKTLRKEGVFCKVYKVTLVKRALAAAGTKGELADYKTPIILSISPDDETAPARLIKNFAKEVKSMNILVGIVDNAFIEKRQVEVLADLPSKQDLRGMVVRVINAPVNSLVNILAGNIRGVINVLNALTQKT